MESDMKSRTKRQRTKRNIIQTTIRPDEQREALLVSIRSAAHLLCRSESAIFELMRQGKLKALKSGRRTVIPVAEIHKHIGSLPARGPGEFRTARPQEAHA
jgi:hypothetical protein